MIAADFDSSCARCGGCIQPGDPVAARHRRWFHAVCLPADAPERVQLAWTPPTRRAARPVRRRRAGGAR